jgi:hypothetical protein
MHSNFRRLTHHAKEEHKENQPSLQQKPQNDVGRSKEREFVLSLFFFKLGLGHEQQNFLEKRDMEE